MSARSTEGERPMTQDKETLREALKRLFKQHHSNSCYPDAMEHEQDKFADAAIATMFERLRTPSDDMIQAGDTAPKPSEFVWQAMLAAFQQENSDA